MEPAWISDARASFAPLGLSDQITVIIAAGKRCRDTLEGLKVEARKRKAALELEKASALSAAEAGVRALVDIAVVSRAAPDCDAYVAALKDYDRSATRLTSAVDGVANDLLAHPDFVVAVTNFNGMVDNVIAACKAADPPLRAPWQLRYCAESDPFAPPNEQVVELQGGKITDIDGNDIWEDACYLTGVVVQAGAFGLGVPRYRCVNAKRKVRSVFAHHCQTKMSAVLEFRPCLLAHDPLLLDWFVEEFDHPVFAHMAVTEAKDMRSAIMAAFKTYAGRPLFGQRATLSHEIEYTTYAEALAEVLKISDFLRAEVLPGEFVGICAGNSERWVMWDVACALCHIPLVGLHQEWPEAELVHVLTQANTAVLVADAKGYAALPGAVARCVATAVIRTVVFLDEGERFPVPTATRVMTHSGVLEREVVPSPRTDPLPSSHPDRVFTVMYSSGTSGLPKGIVVREGPWLSDNKRPTHIYPFVIMSYSALAHGMDRGMCWMALLQGGRVIFPTICSKPIGCMHTVFSDARDVHPSLFVAMPYVWSTLLADYLEHTGGGTEEGLKLERYTKCLGGRIRHVATGGAPISDVLWKFIKTIFGETVVVQNTYGLTEAPGVSTDGVVRPGVDVKLIDVPAMGYFAPHAGEICVRSKSFAREYFRDPERTAVTFGDPEGWIHTKDVGRIDAEGRLHIVDRVAFLLELYVSGRSVWASSSELEALYMCVPNVRNVFVYGDRMYSFLVAVVQPVDPEAATEDFYLAAFRAAAEAAGVLEDYKVPRGVVLDTGGGAWDVASGLRGPNGKLIRDRVNRRYIASIEKKYAKLDK